MKFEYKVDGLDCANCANKIEIELAKQEKLKNVSLNFAKGKLVYESEENNLELVKEIVKKIEPDAKVEEIEQEGLNNIKGSNKESNKKMLLQLLRLVVGIIIAALGIYVFKGVLGTICIILGYSLLLIRTIINATKLLIKSKTINENFLITISSIGAYLIGKHMEGLMVITLYEIGKILEDRAVNKTRKTISDLMDIKPEYANLKVEGTITKVDPNFVNIGDIIVVKPGEKIPLDGNVISGSTMVDTKSLTGESIPRKVEVGSQVLSGSIVLEGLIEVEVTKEYKNSTVNKILELVEEATDKKAKTETFVNKVARFYTPIVLCIAIAVGALLPLVSSVQYLGQEGSIYRALIFLVISCPCAIAISVPLSYFSGIGAASRKGILIKGSNFLDRLKDVNKIIFDKTGTLTTGQFIIEEIESYNENYNEEDILKYLYLGEKNSNHPIAKSIVANMKVNPEYDNLKVEKHEEVPGKGIKYIFEGNEIFVGNDGLKVKETKHEFTNIYLKINTEVIGVIRLSDKIKDDAKSTIEALKKKGIMLKMFTGDRLETAKIIGERIGIDNIYASLLPNEKYSKMEKEIKENTNGITVFVGDGINDSPVLALADIGISMGGLGSSSAIEASDVVIMTDSLEKILTSIKISKFTNRIIKENLIFAIGTKVLVLILSILGIANMWEAVFADVGVTLITIINTLRILKTK